MRTPGRRISGIDWIWILIGVGFAAAIVGALFRSSPDSDPTAVKHALGGLHGRQARLRGEGKAYWTADVAGLLRDVPSQFPGLLQADTTVEPGVPYHGYYFRALPPGEGYYAIVAYPADYGKPEKETFFINGTGLFGKDLGGRILGPGEFVRDGSWSIID